MLEGVRIYDEIPPSVVLTLSLSTLKVKRKFLKAEIERLKIKCVSNFSANVTFSESIICVHLCMEIHYLEQAKYYIDKTLKQVLHYLNINVVHVCMEMDYL